ncbi:MAG: PEP-CTERM sorting domain-containing protein [Pirellulales bacterium]|nr:PEP-CTERM sorting domain-containing protein [Pirellulales bacterium]
MKSWKMVVVLAALFCLGASAVQAGQLVPFPEWWAWPPNNPDGLTRLQYHSFQTDPNLNLPPDWTLSGFDPAVSDQWTIPSAALYNVPTGYMAGLFKGDMGRDLADGFGLYLADPGILTKLMGNQAHPDRVKDLFAVVIWEGPANASLNICVTSEDGTQIQTNQVEITEPTMQNWRATVLTGTIDPQPDWEMFDFGFCGFDGSLEPMVGGVYIDSIYVGTHCVPEPGTLALLLGLLVAGVFAYRRR